MFGSKVIVLTCAILAFCESAAIIAKINKKCLMSDSECQRNLIRSIIQEMATTGIPEMNIPKFDPYVIKHLGIEALGMIKVTITEGTASGLKNCYSTSFNIDIEKHHATIELSCDLINIEGQYKIEPTPTLNALIGGIKFHGEGNGAIAIEKLQLTLDFPLEAKKLDDGELHLRIKSEDATSQYNILGKVAISADNIFIGSQDISTVAVNIINENWEFVTKTFGKDILDKALEVFYTQAGSFLNSVPLKDLVTDDLSSYAKK